MSAIDVCHVVDTPVGAYLHYAASLANALARRSDMGRIEIAAVWEPGPRAGAREHERRLLDPRVGLHVLVPAAGARPRRAAVALARLAHLFGTRSRTAQVVHVHSATGNDALDLALLACLRATGVRAVRTVHELTAAERVAAAPASAERLARRQLRACRAWIAHDAATAERVARLAGDRGSVHVIPHGHYLVFRDAMPPDQSLAPIERAEPVALFLGVKRNKGIEVFLDALARLRARGVALRGRVVGQVNPGDEDLVARIGALPHVELAAGYVANDELWRVHRDADLVALPYLRGTTSGAVQLAFAFERPVVVSDLGCFRGVVADGENGLVTPAGDAEALARALERLAGDPALRRRLAAAGLRSARAPERDWERIAEQTRAVYAGALGRA